MRPRQTLKLLPMAVHCTWLSVATGMLPFPVGAEVPAEVSGETATDIVDLALSSPGGSPMTPIAPDGGFGQSPSLSQSPFTSPVIADNGMLLVEPAILSAIPVGVEEAVALPVSADGMPVAEPEPSAPPADSPIRISGAVNPAALGGVSVLPTAPTGFSRRPGGFPLGGGMGDTVLDGFSFAGTLAGTYDSNVTQSPGEPIAPEEQDFFLSLGGSANYLSKAADWTFGGSYRGSYDAYFDNTDFNGYNQGGSLIANYDGAKLSASMRFGVDYDQGANRYYSPTDFVEVTNITSGLDARYRLSSKTSLQANIGQSFSTSSGDYDDTQSFDLGAAALWKYSPLTEWGPGIRYSHDSGDSQADRNSIGPTMTLNYKLSSKVALNSRVGVDFASYDDGGSSDPMVSGLIGLSYQASRIWGMNFSVFRDAQADPSVAGGFNEITALRLGYQRKIRRATLGLGLGFETNTSETPGITGPGPRSDRDFFSFDGSLGMAIFSNSTMASLFMRYDDQSGSATETFDSLQTGFSLSRGF